MPRFGTTGVFTTRRPLEYDKKPKPLDGYAQHAERTAKEQLGKLRRSLNVTGVGASNRYCTIGKHDYSTVDVDPHTHCQDHEDIACPHCIYIRAHPDVAF